MDFVPRHPHSEADMAGMAGMDHGSGGGGHMVVFRNDMSTPLYSDAWTPTTEGAYAGTCIFLIVLAVIGRLLLALRSLQEARWHGRDARRRYVSAAGRAPLAERIAQNPDAKPMVVLSENGIEEPVVVVQQPDQAPRPWRFSVDPLRAALDTVIVGVGYLLMLAVMSMNVGYFMSVLAGVFLGSLAVGRYTGVGEH